MENSNESKKSPAKGEAGWQISVDLSPKAKPTEASDSKKEGGWQVSVDLASMRQPPVAPDDMLKKIFTHLEKAEWEAAETACRAILKEHPDHKEARKRLGISLYFQKKFTESAETLKALGDSINDDADALLWLLLACREGYDTEGMYQAARKARRIPASPEAEVAIYEALMDARAWRDASSLQENALSLASRGRIRPEQLPYLIVLLNHLPDLSPAIIYDLHRLWGNAAMQPAQGVRLAEKTPPPAPGSRMKIAYMSADFREHPIGKFMRTIFASHDHHRFEVYCYAHMLDDDTITDEIRLASDHFIDITDLDNEKLAKRIHRDGIHTLVEIGSHMAHSRLPALAWKPAPVQITYLAEPNTTGLPTVDFRITDRHSEAPDGTRYSEKLLYMPESFLCMGDLPDFERISVTPAENNGYITFASFNGVRKFNPEVIAVWSKILKRVKDSRLVIKSPGTSVPVIRRNILKEFQRNGIHKDRLEFVEYASFQEHAEWHNKVDIALDCHPYNGTTTTFDTLWMGVPVVTLVGKMHAQRTSYSILKNIGFDTAAAAFTPEEYVDKAVHLAENIETLSFLRRCLPTMIRHSILFQPECFTAQLEELYTHAWEEKMGAWQRTTAKKAAPITWAPQGNTKQTTSKKIKRIFITGMPKSAMPWVSRVVSTLIRDKAEDDASHPTVHFLHAPTGEALKALRAGGSKLIYVRRDLRDAYVALTDTHNTKAEELLERGVVQSLIKDDQTWSNLSQTHTLQHEAITRTPETVVQEIATYLGYDVNEGEAENIAVSCQSHRKKLHMEKHQEEVDNLGLPEQHLLQEEQEAAATDIDPAGMHEVQLSGGVALRLRRAAWEWLLKHQYEQQPYPGVDPANKAMVVNIKDHLKICLPASIEEPRSYQLLEQEDCPEPETGFLRRWIRPGMQCIDIGAGYGCHAIALGKQVGSKGKVWAFEPEETTADFLQHSLDLNTLEHCSILRYTLSDKGKATPGKLAQTAPTGRLDSFREQQKWDGIDFVRLNASKHATRILEGGHKFFTLNSPLIMVTHTTGNERAGILSKLGEFGYTPYRLMPKLNLLVSFDADGMQADTSSTIFFCKKERAEKLRKQGALADSSNQKKQASLPKKELWPELMESLPYARKLLPTWVEQGDQQPGWPLYREALNLYAQAALTDKPPERLACLQAAFMRLSDLLDVHVNVPRLLTLARVALDLDINSGARQVLDEIIGHFDHEAAFTPEEPFLAVSEWAEATDPQDRLADWAMAQAIEAQLSLDTTYLTGIDLLPALQLFHELSFAHAGMERRLQLVRMRTGLQKEPEKHRELAQASESNLNPGFWNGTPEIIPSPAHGPDK